MAISTSQGATISLGPINNTANTSTAYAALDWVAIGEVETIGEFGDSAQAIQFTSLSDGRVRKLKGSFDAGDLALVVANDPLNQGQINLVAASRTTFSYAVRVVLNDAADSNDTDSVFYFRAKVMTRRLNAGGANDITKRAFTLGIDSEIVEIPSVAVSGV